MSHGRQRLAGATSPSCSRSPRRRRGFTLIELLVVVGIIGILAAIALPNYVKLKDKAKEAETKASLHKIQTDLERYAVDHRGEYPPYLLGGQNAVQETQMDENHVLTHFVKTTPQETAADPMLRDGYLDSYPHNPFITHGGSVQDFQTEIGDPLRNEMPDAQVAGTRFGPYGDIMGQCLCDARWLQWDQVLPDQSIQPHLTWTNIEYEFFDAWTGNAPKPYVPGSFMYKSMGELAPVSNTQDGRRYATVGTQTAMLPENNNDEVFYPIANTNYLLAAWGGSTTKGQDILGEEPLVLFSYNERPAQHGPPQFFYNPQTHRYEQTTAPPEQKFSLLGIPPWTRGVNRVHVGPLWGSPFGPSLGSDEQLSDSNPNGLRDGLVLVLSGSSNN